MVALVLLFLAVVAFGLAAVRVVVWRLDLTAVGLLLVTLIPLINELKSS